MLVLVHELVRVGQLVPGDLGHHQDLGNDQVTGQAVYLAHRVVILREQRWRIIFSAVDYSGLQRAEQFIEIMRGLGERLGPMFLQLPPRFPPHLLGELQAFLSVWPQDVRLAVEVRHLDWFDAPHSDDLNQLLRDFNMARVTIDTRQGAPTLRPSL